MFFLQKCQSENNKMLLGNKKIVHEDKALTKIVNYYFTKISTHQKLKPTKIDPPKNLECKIKKIILLFLEMRVTRKIFTRAAGIFF